MCGLSLMEMNVILWPLTICELEPITLNVGFFFFFSHLLDRSTVIPVLQML